MTIDQNGYVTTNYTSTNAQVLAQALIKQAKIINYIPKSITASTDGTIEFKDLELGYYVVDTTVGTLCALTTNQPNATIMSKHEQPTVSKQVFDGQNYGKKNSVNIGDNVPFETTIQVKKVLRIMFYTIKWVLDSHFKEFMKYMTILRMRIKNLNLLKIMK